MSPPTRSSKPSRGNMGEATPPSWEAQRAEIYDKLSSDLHHKGPTFLSSSSPLSSQLFQSSCESNSITPLLKPLDTPVRLIALHIGKEHAVHISHIIKNIFLQNSNIVIWFQDENLYHSSMFHTSHHQTSVPASINQVEQEVNIVNSVASTLSPLRISLDRVVLTSSGVLLGCWKVASGVDPAIIRSKLRQEFPHAPQNQLYEPAILHTSLARFSRHPNALLEGVEKSYDLLEYYQGLIEHVNHSLRGFEVMVTEMWFVEEFDKFALALNGRMQIRKFLLGCN